MPGPLVRWDPFSELSEMRTRLDRMFAPFDRGERSWMPAIDVVRDHGNLIVRADVPGTKAEDIKIEVEDGILDDLGPRRGAQRRAAQALRASRASVRVVLALDRAARRRRPEEHQGKDPRRRR